MSRPRLSIECQLQKSEPWNAKNDPCLDFNAWNAHSRSGGLFLITNWYGVFNPTYLSYSGTSSRCDLQLANILFIFFYFFFVIYKNGFFFGWIWYQISPFVTFPSSPHSQKEKKKKEKRKKSTILKGERIIDLYDWDNCEES